jgi:hypothetical protein
MVWQASLAVVEIFQFAGLEGLLHAPHFYPIIVCRAAGSPNSYDVGHAYGDRWRLDF